MAFRNQLDFVTVPQSERVSGTVTFAGRALTGLFAPNSLGTAAYLQVSHDTASATFMRMQTLAGTADWSIASYGAAGKAITLGDGGLPWTHARVEVASAVTVVSTFVFLGKTF